MGICSGVVVLTALGGWSWGGLAGFHQQVVGFFV
jgi:hypothetical protein